MLQPQVETGMGVSRKYLKYRGLRLQLPQCLID